MPKLQITFSRKFTRKRRRKWMGTLGEIRVKKRAFVCFKMREIIACLFAEENNPVMWGEIDGVKK